MFRFKLSLRNPHSNVVNKPHNLLIEEAKFASFGAAIYVTPLSWFEEEHVVLAFNTR